MNDSMLTALKKTGFTVLFALLTVVCFAQDNVRLLNGSAFISESAASAADGRLATELPNHDVRISYVTSFVGVQDRYKFYDNNDLTTFSQTPYTGGFVPATQEQKDAAVNAGIHHAITTLPAPSESTIHIIYAVSVSLDTEGNEIFMSRKLKRFGKNVTRRAENIVKQIIPEPELEAAGTTNKNGTHLTNYVDELIAALNDPDYIINGTIEFQEETYFDGDYVYYFYDGNQQIITSADAPIPGTLILGSNPQYPVEQVNWSASASSTTQNSIIANQNGTEVSLAILSEHFGPSFSIQAEYGDGKTSTITFIPINPIIELSIPDPIINATEAAIVDGIECGATAKNNEVLWILQGPAAATFNVVNETGGGIAQENFLEEGINPSIQWQRSSECNEVKFILEYTDEIREGTVKRTIVVKCPFLSEGLSAEVIYANHIHPEAPSPVTMRRADFETDTLYVVRNASNENDDGSRTVRYAIEWVDDDEPTPGQFWEINNEFEPDWSNESAAQAYLYEHPEEGGYLTVDYPDPFPEDDPGGSALPFTFNVWDAEVNRVKTEVDVYGQKRTKHVNFLSRNERKRVGFTTDLLPGDWAYKVNLFRNIQTKIQIAIGTSIFGQMGVIQPKIELTFDQSFYNAEDENSYKYLNNILNEIGGTFGAQAGGEDGDFDEGLDFVAIPGYSIEIPGNLGAAGLGFYARAVVSPKLVIVQSKPFDAPALSPSSYDFYLQEFSITGNLRGGLAIFIDENIPGIELEGSFGAGIDITFQVSVEYNETIGEYEVVINFPIPTIQIIGSFNLNIAGYPIYFAGGNEPLFQLPTEGFMENFELRL